MAKMVPNPHGANHIARGAQAYFTSPNSTVWHRVGPIRSDVTDLTGRITVFSKADTLKQQHDGLRAADGKAKQSAFGASTSTYACQHYADAHFCDADTAKSHQNVGVDPRFLYGSYVMGNLHRIIEKKWRQALFVTGKWTNTDTLSGTNQWNSSTGGDPRGEARDAKTAIRRLLGGHDDQVRYVGVCNAPVFDCLKTHPGLDNIGGLQAATPRDYSIMEVARWLGLDDIIVGGASENTAMLGQTASYSDVLADSFLVCVVPQNAMDVRQPTSMLTVVPDGTQMAPVFSEVPQTLKGSFHVEVDICLDFMLVDADLGYLYLDCLA